MKVKHPGPTDWSTSGTEGAIMKAISDLITTEDSQHIIGHRDLFTSQWTDRDHPGRSPPRTVWDSQSWSSRRKNRDSYGRSSQMRNWDSETQWDGTEGDSFGRSSHKTHRDHDEWDSFGRSSHKTHRDHDEWDYSHDDSLKRLRIGPKR